MLGAHELDALADAFDRQAALLEATGDDLLSQATVTTWECNRATRFREGIAKLRGDLYREAADLRRLARDAREIAAAIRAMEGKVAALVAAGMKVDGLGNVLDDAGEVVDRLVPW